MSQESQIGSIHGHEVMRMIVEGAGSLTETDLAEKVEAKFGPDARFHTCSIQDAPLPALLELLKKKGKTVLKDGKLHTEAGQICNHE